MKKLFKILKSYWIINCSGSNELFFVFNIIFIFISIANCYILKLSINDYINSNNIIFNGSLCFLLIAIVLPFSLSQNLYRDYSHKNKTHRRNFSNVLIQVPIKKIDILNTNFFILLVSSLCGLIITLFLLIINIFVAPTDMISAYAGFFVLIFISAFLLFSLSTGLDSIASEKYKFIKFLPAFFPILVMYLGIYNLTMHFPQPNTKVTPENMYNALGPLFSPFFKACRYFGGVQGLLLIILSVFTGYYLCCKLPLKISEKVG
ncbi:hypothetical protein [Clostridium grantii]|uniref:ABC-2 family transporter protein n=1 Tax=Clostridium grantii DSM 8605 TaxID=1121316 RepID=A0A1M5QFC5_9CLOT|nr:hypothetical protein [Clostridium grantii]SHH12895.1 hypothetical protein SAMN02745207_00065 [Clostridium grantii DSM 8605]